MAEPTALQARLSALEAELATYKRNPLSRMYRVWCAKLDEIVDTVEAAPLRVEEGADPYKSLLACAKVMNEARPISETIKWLKGEAGVAGEEEEVVKNPMEARARLRATGMGGKP